jgi:hypothetical protein
MTQPGDAVYMGSILTNVHIWGVVSDIDTPAGMTGTFEILGNDGAITMDALVGPQGPAGENSPIVKMQYASSIDDPDDLPQNLTEDQIDIGKAWWIGNQVFMWDGTGYVQKSMGTQGPPGPTPVIQPSIELIDPEGVEESSITVTGTAVAPSWHLKLKAPRGPQGTPANMMDSPDVDDSTPPETGDALVYNGTKWEPMAAIAYLPKVYSVPEAAFTNFTGLTTRQQIAAFQVPPQPWPWTPLVFGHIRAVGVELDADPLILGCEVRLENAASGTLIARGFGNISTYSHIVPHYSTPQSSSDAITPDNGYATVAANHTGTEGTLYVNLFNDGLTGAYAFNRNNAQLVVMVVPTAQASIWSSGA